MEPISSEKVYVQITNRLKDMIINGELKPGDRLPSERKFAEQVQVSRTSIREAIRTLELMGLVEVKVGKGTFIKNFNKDDFIEHLNILLNSRVEPIHDFYEIRTAIECRACELIIEKATDKEINKLEEIVQEEEAEIKAAKSGIKAGKEFHNEMIKLSGSALLYKIWFLLAGYFEESLKKTAKEIKKAPLLDLQDHKSILQALQARDKIKAREMVNNHIKTLIQMIEQL